MSLSDHPEYEDDYYDNRTILRIPTSLPVDDIGPVPISCNIKGTHTLRENIENYQKILPNETIYTIGKSRLAFTTYKREPYNHDDNYDFRNDEERRNNFPLITTFMNDITREEAKRMGLKLMGVVKDSRLYDGKTVVTHGADVSFSGHASLYVDPNDFEDAKPGDMVYYDFTPSDVSFEDIPGQKGVKLFLQPPFQKNQPSLRKHFLIEEKNEPYEMTREEYMLMSRKVGILVSYKRRSKIAVIDLKVGDNLY